MACLKRPGRRRASPTKILPSNSCSRMSRATTVGPSKPTGHIGAACKSPCYSLETRSKTRMINRQRICIAGRRAHTIFILVGVFALALTCVPPAAAQKKKKSEPPPSTDSSKMLVPLNDEQQIDYLLSAMLGSWQPGDVEKLRTDYADDVAIVNGSWAPPTIR